MYVCMYAYMYVCGSKCAGYVRGGVRDVDEAVVQQRRDGHAQLLILRHLLQTFKTRRAQVYVWVTEILRVARLPWPAAGAHERSLRNLPTQTAQMPHGSSDFPHTLQPQSHTYIMSCIHTYIHTYQ